MNTLKLSIVIPAYNEEGHIAACLSSIAAQTVLPDEVIVVDNGSTDNTKDVAASFKFVKVLSEPKRGIIPAEVTGYRAATGEIIGRFNADVILDPDWVARAQQDFANDPELAALAGLGRTKIIPSVEVIYSLFWSRIYLLNAEAFFKTPILWGANMVMRRSAWQSIEAEFVKSDSTQVHEDQDISLYLAAQGLKIVRDNKLVVRSGEQSYYYWPKLYDYIVRHFRTKHLHVLDGTYKQPNFPSLPWWSRAWRYLVTLPPLAVAIFSSPLVYPLIWCHKKLRRS